nr:uncharacterized protein LOC133613393 isoform X2 [Nerophis lumbriciformis]
MCDRTISESEGELSRTKEENERQRQLLDAVFKKPQVVLLRTDVQQLKESPPKSQGGNSTLKQEDPQPPHIKEEEEGECLLGQEEADLTKFPLTVVCVKTEDHEDKPPESSQLHHSPMCAGAKLRPQPPREPNPKQQVQCPVK